MAYKITCNCRERIEQEINSFKDWENLKKFFQTQVDKAIFTDESVEKPYYIGCEGLAEEIKWYADKWYSCNVCGTLWEFRYPDFPAKGFIRKFPDGKHYRSDE